jgi:ABC-type proline/glycine betaine transport system permease subunit
MPCALERVMTTVMMMEMEMVWVTSWVTAHDHGNASKQQISWEKGVQHCLSIVAQSISRGQ